MAEEEAQDNVTAKKRTISGDEDLQSLIKAAVLSRLSHFKEQADSLTLEGVRRLLEKDLGLKINALETHKRFVRQTLDQALDSGADDNSSKTPSEEEKMEDSPVMGLLADKKTDKEKSKETQVSDNEEVPSEIMIKKAIRERIPYVKANSEKVTMAGFRRLLEEDLELEKFSLDSYKKLISTELDEALNVSDESETANEVKKKNIKNSSKRERSPESSGSLERENNEENEEEELKPTKKPIAKGRMQKLKGATKRRKTGMDGKKRIVSRDNSDAENSESSGDGHASAEKPTKKKEVSALAYGRRVEQLKSVIKLCGMSVPPVIYKKVKQVPENRREAQLINELEGILAREGLSSNPSEKEMKELRKRKDRAKELEGIDMKNIVSSSRRRSTSSFFPPPKPPPVVTAGDNSEDNTSGEDDENNSDSDDEDSDDDEDHVEDEENAGDDAEVKEGEEEEGEGEGEGGEEDEKESD